jgi:hypothetical protein
VLPPLNIPSRFTSPPITTVLLAYQLFMPTSSWAKTAAVAVGMHPQRKVYWSQFLIACCSIFALCLYLLTVSSEIDPNRYIDTTTAIYQKLNLDQALRLQEKYEVWGWLKSFMTDIGGRTREIDHKGEKLIVTRHRNHTFFSP